MKKNKKSDKKIYITFIVVMAVLYGAGYLAGRRSFCNGRHQLLPAADLINTIPK